MKTLACIIARCIEVQPSGVFNAGSLDSLTKAEFAVKLAAALNINIDFVKEGKLADLCHRTVRPNDMSMDSTKFYNFVGFQFPCIDTEINNVVLEYENVVLEWDKACK
jgi:dTDP-4-dehydrorhamnose reductase